MLVDDRRDDDDNPTEDDNKPEDIDIPDFDTVQESEEPDDDKIST